MERNSIALFQDEFSENGGDQRHRLRRCFVPVEFPKPFLPPCILGVKYGKIAGCAKEETVMRIGFDHEKYAELQSKKILERISQFGGKLYMEFGGKLFDDFHASRVLPGFLPDSKMKMLLNLKDQVEIVIAINAEDIEAGKERGDIGITYDADVLRMIDEFRSFGFYVSSVVITRSRHQRAAGLFQNHLTSLGIQVYRHFPIENYHYDTNLIVSDKGFGANEFIETTRPLVVVTAPGPGSGKMAVCLSQLYQEHARGYQAGYAKFETFPVWDLPLEHPVNMAYEAATADLNDVNMPDPYHLRAYGVPAVNYNRDIEIFPVLQRVFEKIYGSVPYQSPTDMGLNTISSCIIDDEACRIAAEKEILRRYSNTRCMYMQGKAEKTAVDKISSVISKAGISEDIRPVLTAARKKAAQCHLPAMAMELPGGEIVTGTGKTSDLVGPSAALILNALKTLAGIGDGVKLISPTVIEPVQTLKTKYLAGHNPRLHSDEVLLALSICAATDEQARKAMEALPLLKGCDAHSTVILPQVDEAIFRRLQVNISCDPQYQNHKLYHR